MKIQAQLHTFSAFLSGFPTSAFVPAFSICSSAVLSDASGLFDSAARICSMRSRREVKPGGAHWRDVHGLQAGSVYICKWGRAGHQQVSTEVGACTHEVHAFEGQGLDDS